MAWVYITLLLQLCTLTALGQDVFVSMHRELDEFSVSEIWNVSIYEYFKVNLINNIFSFYRQSQKQMALMVKKLVCRYIKLHQSFMTERLKCFSSPHRLLLL